MGSPFRRLERIPLGLYLLAGSILIFLTRLPLLLGDNLFVDFDESVVGMMAIDLLSGGPLTPFFWGQSYGLAIFESGACALAFAALGPSDVALRVAMIALWTVGWLFFALFCESFFTAPSRRVLPLVLAVCPAWAIWSGMARGGYVTAFVLSNACLWLLAKNQARGHIAAMAAGVCAAWLFFAHQLFAVALAPLGIALIARRPAGRTLATGWLVVGGTLGVLVVLGLNASQTTAVWQPGLGADGEILAALGNLLPQLFQSLTGTYYFSSAAPTGLVAKLAAGAWCLVLLYVLVWPVARWWRRRVVGTELVAPRHLGRPIIHTPETTQGSFRSPCAVAVLCVLGAVVVFGGAAPPFRYFLPLAIPLVVGLGAGLGAVAGRFSPIAGVLVLLGVGTLLEVGFYPRFAGSEFAPATVRRDVGDLVAGLRREGIEHVYTAHPPLSWTIMFYSGGRIVSRHHRIADRHTNNARRVDAAWRSGEKVAVIGWDPRGNDRWATIAEHLEPGGNRLRQIGERFVWILAPDEALLRSMGFELTAPR